MQWISHPFPPLALVLAIAAVPAAVSLLEADDPPGFGEPAPYGWNEAMKALARRGPEALDEAIGLAYHPDPVVRRHALVVTVAIAAGLPPAPEVDPAERALPTEPRNRLTEKLLLFARDADPSVSFFALRGLFDLHGPATGSPLVKRLSYLLHTSDSLPVPYARGEDAFTAGDRAEMSSLWELWWQHRSRVRDAFEARYWRWRHSIDTPSPSLHSDTAHYTDKNAYYRPLADLGRQALPFVFLRMWEGDFFMNRAAGWLAGVDPTADDTLRSEQERSKVWLAWWRDVGSRQYPPVPRVPASFRSLAADDSIASIVERLGPPDRETGSGLHIHVWDLYDGGRVLVGMTGARGVSYVHHVGLDGSAEDLLGRGRRGYH